MTFNRAGRRIGESHANCRYTDHEVSLVLQLRGEGVAYRQIARLMDMPLSTVYAVCTGVIRAEIPDHWERR